MSDKVAVIARISVRPEAAAEAEAVLRGLVDAATAEDGAVEYVLNQEADGTSFWFYEVYADQEAFDAHGQNPALHAAFGALAGLLAEPPEVHLLTPLQAKHLSV
ncbi:MAG: putative quinol monooxygenase [Acidimicrobiales bacterium]